MTAARSTDEQGIILPSVLIMLALASAVIVIMLSVQDIAVYRSRRFNEAAQANAYVRGGEASVMAALRRDARDAPNTDNMTEGWATIADDHAAIENGTFTLAVHDAQARFNINNLAGLDASAQNDLDRIAAALRLPPSIAVRIAAFLKARGPVRDLADLAQAGLAAQDIARLATMTTALPESTAVNINTADEPLIGALLGNAPTARRLVAQRERRGLLTPDDIAAVRAILPPGLGFTSDYFEVDTEVTVGDTAQGARALVQRHTSPQRVDVLIVRRTHRQTAPKPAPSSD